MKIVFITMLLSLTVWASPRVGDKAIYNFRLVIEEDVVTGTRTMEILKVNGDDVTVREVDETKEGRSENEVTLKASDLYFFKSESELKAFCEKHEGTMSTAEFKGVKMPSCKATDEAGANAVVSLVPFGYLSISLSHPGSAEFHTELIDYQLGK